MSGDNDFTMQFAIRLPDGNHYIHPHSGAVVTWSEKAGAEYVLAQLQAHAASIGIPGYIGTIEHRYCTPFIAEGDPAEQLVDELTTWLKQQSGGKS